MAVPKKRTGKSKQGHRRSNWKATIPAVTVCSNCGALVRTHTVCMSCGTYKGKVVSNKNRETVEKVETVDKQEKSDEKKSEE